MIIAASQTTYTPLYISVLLAVMFYMPTIALSNSVAFYALDTNNLDTVKDFPPIRFWGTVGFIVAMWIVDLTGFKSTNMQFYLSASISILLGFYAFTLPHCPINSQKKSNSIIDLLGLRAFTLFKERKWLFSLFFHAIGGCITDHQWFCAPFLESFQSVPEFANSFGVKHPIILSSLSQMSETFCILLIPFFLRRYGIKKVMLISMFAWVLRFALFGLGDPGSGIWMLVLSMLVYGVAFDFFNISGALFVDQETDISIRSSAQGLFMLMTNGLGATIGSYAAGAVVNHFVPDITQNEGWSDAWFVFAAYALVVAILFIFLFKYKHEPKEEEIRQVM